MLLPLLLRLLPMLLVLLLVLDEAREEGRTEHPFEERGYLKLFVLLEEERRVDDADVEEEDESPGGSLQDMLRC